MDKIGEYLKTERKKNGVSISEASADLNISEMLLKAIEDGNAKAFKDIFELKSFVRVYAKYLGLDVSKMLDEFNDYIFEKTSKISLEDIEKAASKMDNKTDREEKVAISSPYTKIKHSRYDVAPIFLIVAILLFISLIVYLILKIVKDEPTVKHELLRGDLIYEVSK